jgi:hypothetical protein
MDDMQQFAGGILMQLQPFLDIADWHRDGVATSMLCAMQGGCSFSRRRQCTSHILL